MATATLKSRARRQVPGHGGSAAFTILPFEDNSGRYFWTVGPDGESLAHARGDCDAKRRLDERDTISSTGGNPMTSATLIEPPEARIVDRCGEYRCECGHMLRVFGGGRHKVYFEPANTRLDDPVMNGTCRQCGRGLPGKTRS